MEDRFKKTKSFKKQNKTTTGKLRKKKYDHRMGERFFYLQNQEIFEGRKKK